MPSRADGLSIAGLEVMSYGLPIIMFSDSESTKDLYDKRISCFAEKNDESLIEAIIKWYMNDWDKDYIDYYEKRLSKH